MRKNKYSRPRIHVYSLVELMAVIALIAMLFNGALYLFYNGNRLSRTAADRAQTLKTASALSQSWRNLVHAGGAPTRCSTDRVEFANGNYAALEKNRLFFVEKNKNPHIFALPSGATASFAREDIDGEAPVLVLSLRPLGSKGQKVEDKFIRMAAVTVREVQNVQK